MPPSPPPDPDVELIVAAFLRAHADVDPLVDDVFTDLTNIKPSALPAKFVVVHQLGGPVEYPRYLVTARLQLEAWHRGGTKPSAKQIINMVKAVLPQLQNTTHSDGVIGTVDVATPRWEPDSVPTPATPRWLLDATVTAHP